MRSLLTLARFNQNNIKTNVFRRTVTTGGQTISDHRHQQVQVLLKQFNEFADKKNKLLDTYNDVSESYACGKLFSSYYTCKVETLKFQIEQMNTNLYMIRNILQDYAVNKQVNGHLDVSIQNKDI